MSNNDSVDPNIEITKNEYKLVELSQEQQQIVQAVIKGKNVIVDSVSGSGKTTTCLSIASKLPQKKILLLTYNSRLKIDSREKVKMLNLTNIEVHSYHAFSVKYYNDKAHRNDGIKDIINNCMKPKRTIDYDIIIMDECQDMTLLFYVLSKKIIRDNVTKNIQLCLVGDIYQNIYAYMDSDDRYLCLADKIFNTIESNYKEWVNLKISTSYRITKQMADFINIALIKTNRLKTIKNGPPIKYVITNAFEDTYVYNEILRYLNMGYLPQDIFILGASLKKGTRESPIQKLENKLVERGIPCYASNSDDTVIDNDIINGKVCFGTYNQTKGMERKICIIFGFDKSYFDYYAKDLDPNVCPNVLYVATTRASERLILVHHYQNDFLPFIDKHKIRQLCEVKEIKRWKGGHDIQVSNKPIAVCDLIKNISQVALDYIFDVIKYKHIQLPNKSINIKSKINTENDLYENVSDINGLAIPAMYEYNCTKKISMLQQIVDYNQRIKFVGIEGDVEAIGIAALILPDTHIKKLNNVYNLCKKNQITINEVLYVANVYNSLRSGFINKRESIDKYDWIEHPELNETLLVMKKYVSDKAIYEKGIKKQVCSRTIKGSIDIIDDNNIFEIKCVSELSKEHILQLAIYSYLYESNTCEKTITNCSEIIAKYENEIENKKVVELAIMCKNNNIDLYKKVDENIQNSKKIKKNKADLIMSLIDLKLTTITENNRVKKNSYMLLNILTEEIIEVEYCDEYCKIIDYLMNKFLIKKCNDDEFVNRCINSNVIDTVNINDDNDGDNGYLFI